MNKHLVRELNAKAATMARAMDETYDKHEKLREQMLKEMKHHIERMQMYKDTTLHVSMRAAANYKKCARLVWWSIAVMLANALTAALTFYICTNR